MSNDKYPWPSFHYSQSTANTGVDPNFVARRASDSEYNCRNGEKVFLSREEESASYVNLIGIPIISSLTGESTEDIRQKVRSLNEIRLK